MVAKNLCAACYGRWRKYGDPSRYSAAYMKRFDRLIDDQGYAHIYDPDHPNARRGGRVPEHRYVMSKLIGRPLTDAENVHHRNGVKSDNRPANLELWVSTQPKGQRPEDLVEWANEILAHYGPAVLAALKLAAQPEAKEAA